jgi:hypothetical protein
MDQREQDRGPVEALARVEPAVVVVVANLGVGTSAAMPGAFVGDLSAEEPAGATNPELLDLSLLEGPRDPGPLLMKPRLFVTKRPT